MGVPFVNEKQEQELEITLAAASPPNRKTPEARGSEEKTRNQGSGRRSEPTFDGEYACRTYRWDPLGSYLS
jgi:hypothetical protein